MSFFDRLSLDLPIIQAPMAAVSTPAMAAAVSNAGALARLRWVRRMRPGLP